MPWNWQLPNWPNFICDFKRIAQQEKKFLLESGSSSAFLKNLEKKERNQFVVEILSLEGLESSKIEGEILDRKSLQSSIKRNFGIQPSDKDLNKESRMAKLLCDVYETFDQPLTHGMLWQWHAELFFDQKIKNAHGSRRTDQ
jgi:Fic family protein